MKRFLTLSFILLAVVAVAHAQSEQYLKQWNDPAIQDRIAKGIEQNRKGDAKLVFKDAKGAALKDVEYEVIQTGHTFLFGANIFMQNGFDKEEENKKYESTFVKLFNFASVPFYWKTLEPQRDHVRFAASSEKIYRRPPPDPVVDFCKRAGLTMKGHTLVWENPTHAYPEWLPQDTAQITQLIDKRIKQIAERYNSSIKIWDVVNESLQMHKGVLLPKDYVFQSFKAAQKYMPDAMLILNETTNGSWMDVKHANSPLYLQAQALLLRGAKIDAIGMQMHFFGDGFHEKVVEGSVLKPADLFVSLDLLSDFKKPLHVTEITFPTFPNQSPEGEKVQARITEDFYKLWFSHPNVEAITWWNTVDNTAVPGEDKWMGGLLNRDFSVKQSYTTLDNLINKQWKTNLKGKASSDYSFRGFYGTYTVKAKKGKKIIEKQVTLVKGSPNEFVITL